MALERRDPVPPGRYSVFIDADRTDAWAAWVRSHGVKVLQSIPRYELVAPGSFVWSMTLTFEPIKKLAGIMVLFELSKPTPWVNIGLPTIESGAVSSEFKAEHTDAVFDDEGRNPFAEVQRIILMGAAAFGVFYLAGKFFEGKGRA